MMGSNDVSVRTTWQSEWPHWLLIGVLLAVLAATPATSIPTQSVSGVPKWLAAVLVVGVYVVFLVLPRVDPARANYAQFIGVYNLIRLAVLALLVIVLGSVAFGVGSVRLIPLGVGVLYVVGGAALGKVRPTWFFGIRTPWTLSSKRSWVKTHRVGGWLFMFWGLVVIVVGLLLPAGWIAVMIGGVLVVLAILLVYSYLVWRADPDKEPAISARPAP